MAQVELINLCKSFTEDKKVVDNVNLTVNDKEFVVLVGPSGCGKSTTLRMVAGLESITGGEIKIDGKLVNEVAPKNRDIAMVFQNYALYPHMTVFENMAFGLKIRKINKEEVKERVYEAAKILGLEDLLERKPKALSGGQRQRVAVGRAIVRKPKVFLFDEPLSNLDAKLRVQMRAEISKLHRALEATIIYVTHDQVEAMTMGDRICVMDKGVVQQVDKPLQIYKKPTNKFVASFIGSPSMNFIPGKIIEEQKLYFISDKEEIKIELNKTDGIHSYVNKEVVLGIRPEDFVLTEEVTNEPSVNVSVNLAEPLGNEIFVYFSLDDIQTTARLISDKKIDIGDKLQLKINANKISVFNKEGESII